MKQLFLLSRQSAVSAPVVRTLTLLAVCALLVLPGSRTFADHEDGDHHPTLTWQVESSHSVLGSQDASFYLRLRIKAAKAETKRQPINLALVFDRSGSMKEESKIGHVRQAGHLVTDNLTSDDYVAFVAFNHEVHVLAPLHKAVNREYLHHRIDELHAEGQTNLGAGLLEGCAQVRKRENEPGLHHVILLTDGLANRGVTNPEALAVLVERCTQHGVTVTTIGVGTEYNEKLLSRLAQAGRGRYAYVSEPDKIPAAFEKELGALLTVVAQNAKLTMKLPPGVEVQQVFGREEPLKPGVLELSLGDLSSGEERVLLVKLHADAQTQSNGSIELRGVLTYDDIAEAQRNETEQLVTIDRASGGSQTTPVLAYAQLVVAVDKIGLAVQGMDRKLAAEVLDIRQRSYPALKKIAKASRDQDFFNKAFMFEHYARELQDLVDRGALHEHSAERAKLQKELHYRSYLMEHHHHKH
ncbi:MAG: VWA domain-containing protein [Planctomycetes bacterium]|nr:VWA domain-containing protein [Planctomycetota bacterium]